jgi:hypothetical protein
MNEEQDLMNLSGQINKRDKKLKTAAGIYTPSTKGAVLGTTKKPSQLKRVADALRRKFTGK